VWRRGRRNVCDDRKNGRVSRLIEALQSYKFGCEVGRSVSLESLAGRAAFLDLHGLSLQELGEASSGWLGRWLDQPDDLF
jgi:hypothetical protein